MISNLKKISIYSLVLAIVLLSTDLFAGMGKILEKTFKVNKGELLKIEIDVGDLKINSWDKDECYIKITGNKNAKEDIEFEVEKTSYGVYIKGEKEDGFFDWSNNYNVLVEVSLPRDFNTELRTSGGDIHLTDIDGKNELKTSGGDVEIKFITGEINARTSGGDMKLNDIVGFTRISTSGGDIDVRNLKGDIDASTSGGNVELEVENGKIDASTSGGNVRLTYKGGNKGIDLSTSGGNINVTVPRGFKAHAMLKTSAGEVSCDVSATKTIKVSSSKFEAELNGGGPNLECRTSGGNIDLIEK
ncbi:MAG: DUF4097 family beta strand repeat-containing protein [bacterium]